METAKMPNGGTTDDQIKALWKALGEKQDSRMCQVMHEALKGDMGSLSSSIKSLEKSLDKLTDKFEKLVDKLTDKIEDLKDRTWKNRLKIALIIAGSGTVGGGLTALILKLIESAAK